MMIKFFIIYISYFIGTTSYEIGTRYSILIDEDYILFDDVIKILF
jgi:hypothetical protein